MNLFLRKSALISPCVRYRYSLARERMYGTEHGQVTWVMLNPSTADAEVDDPTIRRLWGYTEAWGYRRFEVVNLFAWRATKPRDLWTAQRAGEDIIGSDNDAVLLSTCQRARLVIVGWGAPARAIPRAKAVVAILQAAGVPLHALKATKAGHPGHPLYLKASLTPTPWIAPWSVSSAVAA